jgi:twitching motility protein PilT
LNSHGLIDDLLRIAFNNKASDLFVRTGDRIRLRINGIMVCIPVDKVQPPTREQVTGMIRHLLRTSSEPPDIETVQHLDFHYSLEEVAHFRIHVMRTCNNFGIVARVIPSRPPTVEQLNLPASLHQIAKYRHGLILMAGTTGSGKSTTMAAMIAQIIHERPVHVVTLEDPLEFRYGTDAIGTVSQREIGRDVADYSQGLIDAMRESPDVILVGEARDREVLQQAITAAETGHLVMATVHATTAVGTMQRFMSAFGLDEQDAIRERLAENLRAIIVQKLLPLKSGQGRIAAVEIMIRNSVIKHFILDPERWCEIPRAMEEGKDLFGSQSFDQHLQELVESDQIEYKEALSHAVFPEDFAMRMGRQQEI